jgi:hypothetical protein
MGEVIHLPFLGWSGAFLALGLEAASSWVDSDGGGVGSDTMGLHHALISLRTMKIYHKLTYALKISLFSRHLVEVKWSDKRKTSDNKETFDRSREPKMQARVRKSNKWDYIRKWLLNIRGKGESKQQMKEIYGYLTGKEEFN